MSAGELRRSTCRYSSRGTRPTRHLLTGGLGGAGREPDQRRPAPEPARRDSGAIEECLAVGHADPTVRANGRRDTTVGENEVARGEYLSMLYAAATATKPCSGHWQTGSTRFVRSRHRTSHSGSANTCVWVPRSRARGASVSRRAPRRLPGLRNHGTGGVRALEPRSGLRTTSDSLSLKGISATEIGEPLNWNGQRFADLFARERERSGLRRPSCRCPTSNSTFWPSSRLLQPSPTMFEKCTKMSSPCSRRNEAVALFGVEELDRALCHEMLIFCVRSPIDVIGFLCFFALHAVGALLATTARSRRAA